jgi:hypothetical protein
LLADTGSKALSRAVLSGYTSEGSTSAPYANKLKAATGRLSVTALVRRSAHLATRSAALT